MSGGKVCLDLLGRQVCAGWRDALSSHFNPSGSAAFPVWGQGQRVEFKVKARTDQLGVHCPRPDGGGGCFAGVPGSPPRTSNLLPPAGSVGSSVPQVWGRGLRGWGLRGWGLRGRGRGRGRGVGAGQPVPAARGESAHPSPGSRGPSTKLFLFMRVSVGWPLSRQRVLSLEAILECAAHLLRTEDGRLNSS